MQRYIEADVEAQRKVVDLIRSCVSVHLLHNRGWRRWRRVCDERAALVGLRLLHGVEFAVQLGELGFAFSISV